jgi:hypothetical protein
MKKLCVSALFLLVTAQAFADEEGGGFRLLDMGCKADTESGPDTSAQSPPLDVDDPGTPGCNRWEINVLADADVAKRNKQYELPLLDLNYGIGDNLQLKYEVPLEKSSIDGVSDSRVGDSKFGIKYMFYENENSGLQLAFYPQVEFLTPGTKNDNKQDAATGNIVSLPLLLSKNVGENDKGDINLTANLAYNLSTRRDTEDSVFFAAGAGFGVTENLALMGEISTEQALRKNVDDVREELVKANFGLIEKINNEFSLYGSLGHSLKSSDNLDHTYAVVGFRILTE